MKKLKNNKAITLIALIITIVVLLILAVVAINSVKDGGILAHAKNAQQTYKNAADNESALLQNYVDYLTEHTKNEEQIENAITPLEDFEYTIDEENKTVTLTKYIGLNPVVNVQATYVNNNTTYNTMLWGSFSSQKGTFSANLNITGINIQEGVSTNEMSYMFANSTNLRYVNRFPNYNGVWWTGVFYNDTNLISAPQIPNNIEKIRITNFYNKCINLLGNYSLPDDYNSNYVSNVFNECKNINKNTNIVWFGDSITAGTTTASTSFVTYLREDLVDTGIANYAVGGHTLSYGYDNDLDDINSSIINDINKMGIHENVDYVFVSAGTNDFAHNSSRRPYGTYRFADIGSIDDISETTVLGAINNIRKIVSKKFPNAKLVFTTPITRANYDVDGATTSDTSVFKVHLKDYVDSMKNLFDAKNIPYFDAYTESELKVSLDPCDGSQYYQSDRTHPTLKGQKKLEEYILNKLISIYGFSKIS